MNRSSQVITQEHLGPRYGSATIGTDEPRLIISGALLPNAKLIEKIEQLSPGHALVSQRYELLAIYLEQEQTIDVAGLEAAGRLQTLPDSEFAMIRHPWDLFRLTEGEILADLELAAAEASADGTGLSDSNRLIGSPEQLFMEEQVYCEAAILNVQDGPIYLSKNCKILEGAMLRGPLYIGPNSTVKMGAKVYGKTSLGSHCKVGGEISNVTMQAYSNKGHDGYLGNAVIGEWCNIGADTNASNLKNNYAEVKAWSYRKKGFIPTGSQFCGLIMADHAKCGINTMFNTGTVVGVSSNVYGSGFPRNFIPSFSWGGASGLKTYNFEKAMETASLMMKRRSKVLDEQERAMLEFVYEYSSQFRRTD